VQKLATILAVILVATLAIVSCNSITLSEDAVEYSYQGSFKNINNPERGLYKLFELRDVNKTVTVIDVRACVENKYTLLLYKFILADFVESDISKEYLGNVAACFRALREGGAKCILRFAYTPGGSHKANDASEEWILRHIEQLAPVIQENSDVILCWQTDFSDSQEVLDAMLRALPQNRQIAVRSSGNTHDCSPLSRIGAFNDCYASSPDNAGAYRYVLMGGETCKVYDPSCRCGFSISNFEEYHWTYLFCDNHQVHQRFQDGESFDEVELRLGYRFVLENAYIPQKAAKKSNLTLGLALRNDGFAAPQNPRGFELVFVNQKGRKTVCPLENDPRYLLDGERYVFEINVPTPAKAGTYKVYLNFPDPEPSLYGNPAYSIRLANKDIWDAETGYNYLADIVIK